MEALNPKVTPSAPPRHIAIIMDGNGRWARARGLPRIAGHQRGADAVRRVVAGCRDLGICYLTLYAFSSENWKRPPSEIDDLMGLLRLYLRRELADLNRNNVCIRFIGERARLPQDIIAMIIEAEAATAANTGLRLTIALNYGSHNEIVRACRRVASDVRDGQLGVDDVTEERFAGYLETADMPDPDLLIRTSGEQRLSNFLLWQAAYSELIFVDTYWPDFTKKNLEDAVHDYQRRDRRYGGSGG